MADQYGHEWRPGQLLSVGTCVESTYLYLINGFLIKLVIFV
jgi:hypothetical protein